MSKFFYGSSFFVAFVLIFFASCGSDTSTKNGEQNKINPVKVKSLVDELTVKYNPNLTLYNKAKWYYLIGKININNLLNVHLKLASSFNSNKRAFEKLKRWRGNIDDITLSRRCELWYKTLLFYQGDSKLTESIVETYNRLLRFYKKCQLNVKRYKKHFYIDKMSLLLKRYLLLINQQAKDLGFKNYYEMLMSVSEIDTTTLQNLRKQVEQVTTAPLKKHLSNYDFKSLSKKQSMLDKYFKKKLQKRYITNTFKKISFPLDEQDVVFNIKKMLPNAYSPTTHGVSVPDDVHLYMILTNTFASIQRFLKETVKAVYLSSIKQKYIEFNEPNLIVQEGIIGVIEGLLYQKNWIKRCFKMSEGVFTEYQKVTYLQSLIKWRNLLLSCKFEQVVFENGEADYDGVWEALEHQFLLGKVNRYRFWVLQLFESLEKPAFYELLGNVFAVQLIKYWSDYGDGFSFNEKLGSFLENKFFIYGNRYDFKTLLYKATKKQFDTQELIDFLSD